MSIYTTSSELFFTELMRISTDIVWKNPTLAKKNEDPNQSIYVEQYMLARQGKLTFDLIFSFDYDVLIASGLTEKQAADGSEVSYEIPESKRDICTSKQIERILQTYDEPNAYYRMLSGKPAIGDTKFVYNTKYADISDSTTPLHELSADAIYLLESNGYIDEMVKLYPDKLYLKHMGKKKIDPYVARKTDDYGILWLQSSEFSSLVDDFMDTYNLCRYMITSIYTSYYGRVNNDEYTGFIGMVILFATIMQMHKNFLDADITRDFYDQDSLKYVYDSYGVPFYSSIPLEYHKLIVKNINRLISYKGSTQVIYELFDIFSLPDMSIFEYYILKKHKFSNGKPVFVKNDDGSYNYKEMYDIKFSKVRVLNDPMTDITNEKNHVDYDDMVMNDPYWITDEDLMNKLYSEEYNYTESKYLGIQTTFDMMAIVYECCYYIKMIMDNRSSLDSATLFNNNTKTQVSLFDSLIYTCALLCKNYGYEGNIPTKPHEIGQFLGFNFKTDLETLKQNISKSDYLKNDSALLEYLISMKVNSLESVNELYKRMTELRSYLNKKMAETSIPDEYWAYYNLYQTLMYSEYAENVFTKSDGTTAESFADMLRDCNYELYNRYLHSDEFDINEEVSYMLYSIKTSCSTLENIEYLDNVNINIIIEYMLKLINFFKSSKADVTEYIIIYSLVHALDNRFKLMGYIERINDSTGFVDYIDELTDLIALCRSYMHIKDIMYQLLCIEKSSRHTHYIVDYIAYLQDHIKVISHLVKDIADDIEIHDHMTDANIFLLEDEYTVKDMVTLLYDDVQEIIKYMVHSETYTYDVITTIKEVLKDSGRLKSDHEFETMIFGIITSQKLKTSYSLDANISEVFTLDTATFVYAFTDSLMSAITKYQLPMSEAVYHEIIDSIIEHIGLYQIEHSDYCPDGFVERGYDKTSLTKISAENYVKLLSDIIENIFIHYPESDLLYDFELRVDSDTSSYTSTLYHIDTESLYNFAKIKRTSGNVLSDQIILLHETIEEE